MTLFERKDKIQKEAFESWIKSGYNSLLALATGVGKSRIGLLAVEYVVQLVKKNPRVLLVVPTEKLRDDNWPDEFRKWKVEKLLKYVRTECYVSINKIQNEKFDLVILDEIVQLKAL